MKTYFNLFVLVVTIFSFSCSPSVTEHGVFSKSRQKEIFGQDGVNPITFSKNITMWTFGDTIITADKPGKTKMIANSLAFSETPNRNNIHNLKMKFYRENGKIAEFIKLKAKEKAKIDRLWAFDGIKIKDRVYIYYIHAKITNPEKPLGFKIYSVGLGFWQIPKNWKIGAPIHFKRLPDLFKAKTPAFGASVIKRNNYIYLTGQFSKGFESPLKIARVPVKKIENRKAYEFLKKDGTWTKKIEESSSFFGDVAGECSISYNNHLEEYLITYCQIFTGKIVQVHFKNFNELSHSEKKIIFEPPALTQKEIKNFKIYYSGKEICQDEDKLFAIYINPFEIQPHLLEITF